jgi:hypothetical protein
MLSRRRSILRQGEAVATSSGRVIRAADASSVLYSALRGCAAAFRPFPRAQGDHGIVMPSRSEASEERYRLRVKSRARSLASSAPSIDHKQKRSRDIGV